MPEISKLVITRPSLNHKFYFEDQLNPESSYLEIPPSLQMMNQFMEILGSGAITSSYAEEISYEEIESRENELAADRKSVFFLPRDAYPIDENFKWDPVPGADPKLVPYAGWGFTRQPPFNPFSLTYTYITEYDTLENFKLAHDRIWSTENCQLFANAAAVFENTFELYHNDVKVFPK
jgi:hypothetical protein